MSALDEIRKLLQEDAKAKEVLKGDGVTETDKAGNSTSKAKHPEDDANAKSSSKSERLKQEEEDYDDEELVDEAKKNDDDEDEDEDEEDDDKEDDSEEDDEDDGIGHPHGNDGALLNPELAAQREYHDQRYEEVRLHHEAHARHNATDDAPALAWAPAGNIGCA